MFKGILSWRFCYIFGQNGAKDITSTASLVHEKLLKHENKIVVSFKLQIVVSS